MYAIRSYYDSFSIPSYVSKVNDYLYINLNLDKMVENNIIKPDRTIPIENDYCKTYKLTCRLKIPEGYTINQIPKPAIFKSNAAVFSAEYQKENDTFVITSYSIHYTKLYEIRSLEKPFKKQHLSFKNQTHLLIKNSLKKLNNKLIDSSLFNISYK